MKNVMRSRWTVVGSAIGTGLLIACTALATPVSPSSLTIAPGLGSTQWFIFNDAGTDGGPFGGTCDDSAAFGIDDADSASGNDDAFDIAWTVWIDGTAFVAPATVDLTGTTLLAGPVTMSGLNVWVQYFFSTTHQAARILVIMQNTGSAPINATVQVPINFGSDSDTQVEATSSGDTTVSTADRWVVTSDGGIGDPVNTTVFYGPGSPALTPSSYTQTVFDCSSTDGLGATFGAQIPAASARALMFFAGLGDISGTGNSVTNAVTNAALFDSVSNLSATDLLTGVTAGTSESVLVLNWEGLSLPLPQQRLRVSPAPALHDTSLFLLAVVLTGLGAWNLWRARRLSRPRA
ncbi:MAG: hypothetical protein KatS3mg077_1333 [Candidatus Binatia bacterium]|nr:MAG: hypothetical protein KatS3mg077_1333 [Candidatus Binatia bacterium]